MSATTKATWSNPAEALKAIMSGVITFVGAVVLSLSTNGNSAPTLVQWLAAAVFGLGALVTTYYVPNADAKQKAAVQAVEKVAVDVVEHNPAQAAADATIAVDQYWKQMFVKGNATPPEPVVASKEPLSTVASTVPVTVAPPAPVKPAYTGPIPPVSEPVGATAVSVTP